MNSPIPTPTPVPEAIGPSTAALVNDLASAKAVVQRVESAAFLILPPGYKHVDITRELEKAQAFPTRKRGTVTLDRIEDLVEFAKTQDGDNTGLAYADVDERTITFVFNDNKGFAAGFRDHRAMFKAELTPEAMRWLAKDKTVMTQTEFAEFLEDNIADIAGGEATNLLTVATTIAAATGINFSSAKRLQDGQVQLVYNETINATAGADGKMQVPQKFTLGLRLFKGDKQGYALVARLKYRLGNGSVRFWYELERPERALEAAFDGYVESAKESGYTVLHGQPGGA